jgi:hypothetical protein
MSVTSCVLHEDFGSGVRIWNRTEGRITVRYLLPSGAKDSLFGEIDVAAGESSRETGIFRAYANDRGCVPGTLVAEQNGRQIALLNQPCEGTVWEVRAPGGSDNPTKSP